MALVYHTKFFKTGERALFKFDVGTSVSPTGPYVKISRRRYVNNSGTITRISDLNTKVTQYPNPGP